MRDDEVRWFAPPACLLPRLEKVTQEVLTSDDLARVQASADKLKLKFAIVEVEDVVVRLCSYSGSGGPTRDERRGSETVPPSYLLAVAVPTCAAVTAGAD